MMMFRRWGRCGCWAVVLWMCVACQPQTVDLFARQTEVAALTATATPPPVSPQSTPTLPPAPPIATAAPLDADGDGLRIEVFHPDGQPLDWLPADGQATALMRVTVLDEALAFRPITFLSSGGGRIENPNAITTTGGVGQPLEVVYISDVAAGRKRVEAQVALADGRFQAYSADVVVQVEPLRLGGALRSNAGSPSVRLTLTKDDNNDGIPEPIRGTYPLRLLTDASLADVRLPDGQTAVGVNLLPVAQPDGRSAVEVNIRRLTEFGTVSLSAFVVGRSELGEWRETLYPIYPTEIQFSQVNGTFFENVPEGNRRYEWDTRTPENTQFCAALRGSGEYVPRLVTFRANPILELAPGGSRFILSRQSLAMGETARTDDPRFDGTRFVANYDLCASVWFEPNTGGVYWVTVTAGVEDITASIPAVVYMGGWVRTQSAGKWLSFYDFDGNPLPPLQMSEPSAPQIYFLEPITPDRPAHAVVAFWVRLNPEAAQIGKVMPLDGVDLHWTGRITAYRENAANAYTSNAPTGLGRAWIFVDGDANRYTRSAGDGEWTRVYAIARVAYSQAQLSPSP